jgi:hypothetical protein
MGDYWDDYMAHRRGTLGGDTARADFKRSITPYTLGVPPPSELESPPKVKKVWRASKVDLVIGGLTWFCAWLLLIHQFGGWSAAGIAIIPAGLAAKWWRELIVLAIVGLAIFAWLHSNK